MKRPQRIWGVTIVSPTVRGHTFFLQEIHFPSPNDPGACGPTWRRLQMVLMAVMKQHVSTKGLGFQELVTVIFFNNSSPSLGAFLDVWDKNLLWKTVISSDVWSLCGVWSFWLGWLACDGIFYVISVDGSSALCLGQPKKWETPHPTFFLLLYLKDIEKKPTSTPGRCASKTF